MAYNKAIPELLDENLDINDELLEDHYSKSSLPKDYQVKLEKEFKAWEKKENAAKKELIDKEQLKEMLIADLQYVNNMDVGEYTVFRKHQEVQRSDVAKKFKQFLDDDEFHKRFESDATFRDSVKWFLSGFTETSFDGTKATLETAAGSTKLNGRAIREIMKMFLDLKPNESFKPEEHLSAFKTISDAQQFIWQPRELDEFAIIGIYDEKDGEIQPELSPVVTLCSDNKSLTEYWNIMRTFTHSMVNNTNIGRDRRFIVTDAETDRVLGLIALSSDFLDLTPRDEHIGWSRDIRTKNKMINHTAIASTILPTQPLGFNYLGGKLMALLAVSDVVENAWNERYDMNEQPSKLVGVTTTSLYSTFSQYTHLKYWKQLGHTSGSVKREPSAKVFDNVKDYLKQAYPREYWEWYEAKEPGGMPLKRDYKQRSLSFAIKKLKIDTSGFESKDERGVFFCPLYENYKEYLKMEISEDKLIRRKGFDNSVKSLTALWKEKYALKRIDKLLSENETKYGSTFYIDMISMSWDEARKKYTKEVAR